MSNERRSAPRADVHLKTKLLIGSSLFDGVIRDLSRTGCFVVSSADAERGSILYVEVGSPRLLYMRLQGTIMRLVQGSGFGIRFKELSVTERMLLERLLHHVSAAKGSESAPRTAGERERVAGASEGANSRAPSLEPPGVNHPPPVNTGRGGGKQGGGVVRQGPQPSPSQKANSSLPAGVDGQNTEGEVVKLPGMAEPSPIPEGGDKQVKPSANANVAGRTPLMLAASEGKGARVQALLVQGADLNARDEGGDTALMLAAFSGHAVVVRILLANGADVNAKAKNGWTALRAASSRGHSNVVEILKEAGAQG